MQTFDSTPYLNSQSMRITRRFYAIAGISLLASIAGIAQNTIQFLEGSREWQFFLNYFIGIVGFLLSIISIWMIKRRRIHLAGWSLIFFAILNGLVATVVFTGIGLSMQAIITVAGIIISFEMLPSGQRTLAVVISVAAGLVAFGMDLLPPLWRIPTLSPIYNIILVLVILFFFGIYLYINFKYFNLHTRYLFVVLGINIFSVLLIAITTNYLTSRVLNSNISLKVENTVVSLSDEIDRFLENILINVNVKANSPSLVSLLELTPSSRVNSNLETSVINLLQDWKKQDQDFVTSYAILDLSGINILDTNPDNMYRNESIFDYFLSPIDTGLAYVSPFLLTSPGDVTLNFSAPIKNYQNELLGVLRIRFNKAIINSIVASYNELAGEESFGAVIDESGIILAHGTEPDLVTQPIRDMEEDTVQILQQELRLAPVFKSLDFSELWHKLNSTSENVAFDDVLLLSGNQEHGYVAVNRLKYQEWIVSYFLPVSSVLTPSQIKSNTLIFVSEIIALIVSIFAAASSRVFTSPIYRLVYIADQFTRGNFSSRAKIKNDDEIGSLADTLNSMGEQLTNLLEGLEDQVQERTHGIETSAEIGRRLSTILNTRDLITEVVNQLQMAFNYYHVHIYLVDKENQNLIMAGGTGEAGRKLIEKNHSIPLGVGLVGRAAKTRGVVLVKNTMNDSGWLPNPFLPDTQSEISVPIILSDKVLGVLDVQEKELDKLGNEDAALLQLVAGQVAIALRNAQYVETTQERALLQKGNRTAIEKIQKTMEVNQAMKVAVREIGRLTKASETFIKVDH